MSDIIADLELQTKNLMSGVDSNETRHLRIAVDECSNNLEVKNLIIRLGTMGAIDGGDPVWQQRRIRTNGSSRYSVGGASVPNDPRRDWGKPAKYASWPDHHVLAWVLAILSSVDVILISENRKWDRGGLRHLLQDAVCPNLGPPVKLVCCFKKGKTDYTKYCADVFQKVKSPKFNHGCTEYLI